MPTYSYACTECDNRFDVVQAFSDDALTECPKCDGRLRKLFGKVGVVFKGSGFYRNDSREAAKSAAATAPRRAPSPRPRARRTPRARPARRTRSRIRPSRTARARHPAARARRRPPPQPPADVASYPQPARDGTARAAPRCLAWRHGGITQSVGCAAGSSTHWRPDWTRTVAARRVAAGALVVLAAVAALRTDPHGDQADIVVAARDLSPASS